MSEQARVQAAILPGGRLHLNDGPIDLVIGADGPRDAVRRAYAAAARRFANILDELCDELAPLRAPMHADAPSPDGTVAGRMDRAVRPLSETRFITRMAAVAGAVADEVLAAMLAGAPLSRAYVNNGGDIALHLSPGAVFDVGLVSGTTLTSALPLAEGGNHVGRIPALTEKGEGGVWRNSTGVFGTARITHADPIRGIATSGFGGRSFSLGIADAVTVLARDAAAADAAATLIANAVDIPGHPEIIRIPARDRDPQSDLGDRLVTHAVGTLSGDEIAAALTNGAAEAERLGADGWIVAAALSLRGTTRTVGSISPPMTRLHHVV